MRHRESVGVVEQMIQGALEISSEVSVLRHCLVASQCLIGSHSASLEVVVLISCLDSACQGVEDTLIDLALKG